MAIISSIFLVLSFLSCGTLVHVFFLFNTGNCTKAKQCMLHLPQFYFFSFGQSVFCLQVKQSFPLKHLINHELEYKDTIAFIKSLSVFMLITFLSFSFVFGSCPVVLTPGLTSGITLAVLGGPYGKLDIEPGLAAYKVSTLLTALSLQFPFFFCWPE